MNENFVLNILGALEESKSKKQINADIKQLEKVIKMLHITGTFAKGNTKKELNAYITQLSNQLSTIKLKTKIDSRNLKSEMDRALRNVSFKDIEALNIDESKTKLKIRKILADVKAYADRSPITVNIESKKNKLDNDLKSYLNKNTKINESSILLKEVDKVREFIGAINDKKSLREAMDAFQLFKSEVSATGFNTKSTTDKIKGMLSNLGKIGSAFGAASMAVNNFTKSLGTLKSMDDILTEISKTSNLTAQELERLGDSSFKLASKYGKTANDYLIGIQEMSRSGFYGERGIAMAEQSLLAQAAGDMNAEIANKYILATNAAYKYNGEAEKLNAVLDGQNSITNRNSVSLEDMALAMSEAGTVASSYRVSIEDLSAMIGTMEAVTKAGGNEVGNSLKSILINLQNVTSSKIRKTLDEANASMVEFVNGADKLRDPISILRDLAVTFNQLGEDDALRAEILTNIGGKHQATKLAALLQNMEMFDKMLVDYSEGSNSAMEEAMKSANNWSGKLNQLQNSWDSLVNSLTSKSTVLQGISFFDRLIQGTETLITRVGEIPMVLTTLNASMVAMNKKYGITSVWDKEVGKLDIQGNMFGIDFTAIKNLKKHFSEAEEAMLQWNNKLASGENNLDTFRVSLVQNNAQFKEYLKTTSKDAPASLAGYKRFLEAAGISTDTLRIKTILLNSAISMGIGIAIQVAVNGITYLMQKQENLRQATTEATNAYKETSSSIEDYTSRYQELRKSLLAAKGNEEETLAVKQQLLELQKELNEKFGEEQGRINLVTSAYRDQTEAIKAYNKEAAQSFLNENYEGIKEAKKQMTGKKHYQLSETNVSLHSEYGKELKKIAEFYEKDGMYILSEEGGNFFSIHLEADVQSARDTMNAFMDDVESKAEELGDKNLFNHVLEFSSEGLREANETIKNYRDAYHEALMAEIVKDDGVGGKSQVFQKALDTVEAYNDAVMKSEDPYSDKKVAEARQNLEEVKTAIQGNAAEWGSYADITKEVFDQVDTRLYDFGKHLREDTELQSLTKELEGLNEIDLNAMLNDGDNGDVFDKLSAKAKNYGIEAEELIGILTDLKIIQGEVQDSALDSETLPSYATRFQSLWDSDDFSDSKKELQKLSMQSRITEKDILSLANENATLSILLDDTGMSAQFAASCFTKVCQGADGFSAITEDSLALDRALNELEGSLVLVKNAKSEYDKSMEADDYDSEFKNYQEAYKSAMEMFDHGEYGKHFRSTMEYLLGDKSYTMEIDELYQAVKNLKNVFGDKSTNGLEFLDKLYSKKEILDDLDSSLKKLSDGSYKFDLKPEEFEQIADSLGMTTEGVAACVNALGMFGEFKAYDIETIEKTLKDFSIAVEDSGKSILSLQAVEQMLSDLGRTDYEIVSIMQDIQGLGSIKLLDFEASDEKTLDGVISKLKELSLIEISGKNINVDSLITNLRESFHMASTDIETFINNIGTNLGSNFNFSDAEGNLLSLKGAIDKVQQSEDDSSIKNMEGLGEATKLAEKEAVILHEDFKKLNASDLSHITWQFTKLGTNIAMLKGQVQGLINQLELAGEKAKPDNYPSPGNSGNNPPPNPGNPNQNNTNQGTAQAFGNAILGSSYATGNIGVEKDETALINELGNETIIDPNTNTYEIVQGGAQFKKLKKGQIILNHLQTKALQKYGKISSFGKMLFRGNASLSGHAYSSGIIPKNNPATNKDWGNQNSTKTSNKKKKSSDKDKDKDKKTKETIDWISRKFDIMAKQLDVIKKKASEVYSTFRNQNKQLDTAIKEIDKQINVYNKAYTKYMKKANSVGLDENLVKKVKDGSLSISDYKGETAEKIEQYKEWYDKAQDVLATITNLKLEQKELARQKLSNIVDDFDRKKSYQEAQASLREAKMGDNPKEKDYNYLIKKQNHMKTNLKKEYEELNKEFKNLMDEGVIKKYSDSWYEWKEKLVDCKVSIADCDNEIKDLTKSIIELRWEKFDTAIEKLTRVQDILKDFTTFFDADTFDGTRLTKAGMANITAAFQGLANAKQEMVNYQSSKKSLAAQLTNGDIDRKYHDEKLKELEDGERQAAIKMKEYRDSILDIYIQGIDAETDAMRDLVQAKKDALDAERDLHNYRNSIADKEEDIVILQKKIAELSKSTDRKDIALRLELEEELANAQKDLSEEQYDHEMDLKQEALDQELKSFEAAQEEKKDKAKNNLEEQERILNDYLTKVQNNYNSTMEYALKYAAEYGISMSEFLSSPWEKSLQKAKEYKDLVESIKSNVKVSASAVDTKQNDYPKKVISENTLGTGILTGIKIAMKNQGTIQSTKSTAMEELYNIKDKNTLIPGTAKRKFKLNGYKNGVKDLKRDELARISENGNYEVVLRPGEGLLAPLQQHDNVLTHAQTESLMGWSQINPMEFMQAINHATMPSVTVQSQSPLVIESVDASVHVSGVTRDEISKEILRECDKIPDKIVKAAYRGGYRPRL